MKLIWDIDLQRVVRAERPTVAVNQIEWKSGDSQEIRVLVRKYGVEQALGVGGSITFALKRWGRPGSEALALLETWSLDGATDEYVGTLNLNTTELGNFLRVLDATLTNDHLTLQFAGEFRWEETDASGKVSSPILRTRINTSIITDFEDAPETASDRSAYHRIAQFFIGDWDIAEPEYLAGDFVDNYGTIYVARVDHSPLATSEPGVGATWETFWKSFGGASGSGDVVGPAGATAGNLPTLDATGKVLADSGIAAADVIQSGNAALTDAREWTGDTVGQAEAEAGTATTRRAWTAQRVAQAIAALADRAWTSLTGTLTLSQLNTAVSDATLDDSSASRTPTAHAASHATAGSDPIAPGDIGAATSAQGSLADSAVQPGDLATVATTGAYSDLSGIPSTFAPSAHASSHVTGGTDKIRDATAAQDGLMTLAYASKLDGIEASATANATNAELRDRATHTGTQTAATISDFDAEVANNSAVAANTAKVTNATHTGDVTGATALTIAANAVTNDKLADMAEGSLKARVTAGAGDPEDITATQARTLLNVADGANNYVHPNHSGDVTSVGDGATTIAATAISGKDTAIGIAGNEEALINMGGTLKKIQLQEIADLSNYIHPNHSGDVTSVGDGATTIAATAISGKATEATLAGTEEVLINAAGTLKKTTTQDIADLGGGGGGIGGAVGTVDNTIPRADGTGGTTLQGSELTIPDAATATQANVALVNVHDGQTNSALRLQPKGTGALILGPAPDGTATGGNARGDYAVDLDVQRSGAAEVASGSNSFKAGNRRATTSGVMGVALGCDAGASAGGYRSIVAASSGGVASGDSSAVIGTNGTVTASAINSLVAALRVGTASADQAIAMGGFGAHAHLANMHAQGCSDWGSNGTNRNAGSMNLRWFGSTTDGTQTELGIYRASFRRAILRTHESWSGILTVQGLRSGSADWGSAHYQVHITRDGSTVSADINQLGTNMGSNSGDLPTSWAIDVDADTTNHSLRVRVTGVAATTIRWAAFFNGGLIRHDA